MESVKISHFLMKQIKSHFLTPSLYVLNLHLYQAKAKNRKNQQESLFGSKPCKASAKRKFLAPSTSILKTPTKSKKVCYDIPAICLWIHLPSNPLLSTLFISLSPSTNYLSFLEYIDSLLLILSLPHYLVYHHYLPLLLTSTHLYSPPLFIIYVPSSLLPNHAQHELI